MLKQTFIHLPGINQQKEQKLWSEGILCWNDFLKCAQLDWLSRKRMSSVKHWLHLSQDKLQYGDVNFFVSRLPVSQYWRLFPEFESKMAFLDIETTGLDKNKNYITTIAFCTKETVKTYVRGKNLHDFIKHINYFSILVTYNGRIFDIPFIEHEFSRQLSHFHIDLRWLLSNIGYRGGQKTCEKELGISRGKLEKITGKQAVDLWNVYQCDPNMNKDALNTLIDYNKLDAVNLKKLFFHAYKKNVIRYGIQDFLPLGVCRT